MRCWKIREIEISCHLVAGRCWRLSARILYRVFLSNINSIWNIDYQHSTHGQRQSSDPACSNKSRIFTKKILSRQAHCSNCLFMHFFIAQSQGALFLWSLHSQELHFPLKTGNSYLCVPLLPADTGVYKWWLRGGNNLITIFAMESHKVNNPSDNIENRLQLLAVSVSAEMSNF